MVKFALMHKRAAIPEEISSIQNFFLELNTDSEVSNFATTSRNVSNPTFCVERTHLRVGQGQRKVVRQEQN